MRDIREGRIVQDGNRIRFPDGASIPQPEPGLAIKDMVARHYASHVKVNMFEMPDLGSEDMPDLGPQSESRVPSVTILKRPAPAPVYSNQVVDSSVNTNVLEGETEDEWFERLIKVYAQKQATAPKKDF